MCFYGKSPGLAPPLDDRSAIVTLLSSVHHQLAMTTNKASHMTDFAKLSPRQVQQPGFPERTPTWDFLLNSDQSLDR